MRSISTFFSCIEKVQMKSSKQSTSASLHRHHFREGKNLLKIKCTEYFKNKPKQAGNCFWLAFRDMECSRGKNAANNSLHILRMFSNAANWNYLILSITKSNFLFICVSGSIKLKQWLLYASRVLLFFSFICNVSGISSRLFIAKKWCWYLCNAMRILGMMNEEEMKHEKLNEMETI